MEKNIHSIFSVFRSFLSYNLLVYDSDFNPIEKPLSYFGVAKITAWYWNVSLLIISFAIYINAKKALGFYFSKKLQRTILNCLLIISFFGLFITAIIPMDNELLHRISASLFFLTYNFFVFCFGVFRSSKDIRKGLFRRYWLPNASKLFTSTSLSKLWGV